MPETRIPSRSVDLVRTAKVPEEEPPLRKESRWTTRPPDTTAPEPVRTAVPDLLGGGSVVLGVLVGAAVTLAVTIGPAALMRESYSDSVMFSLLAVVLAAGVVLTLVQRTRRTGLGLLLGILVAALVALAFFVALLATF